MTSYCRKGNLFIVTYSDDLRKHLRWNLWLCGLVLVTISEIPAYTTTKMGRGLMAKTKSTAEDILLGEASNMPIRVHMSPLTMIDRSCLLPILR